MDNVTDPVDELAAQLAMHWQSNNRQFVTRKLVGMPSVAQACYCAALIALGVVDPLEFLAELRHHIPRPATVRERELARPVTDPDERIRTAATARRYSLSDLPDVAEGTADPDEWD